MTTKENQQPLFSLARAVLEECEKQAERWLEYGIAQSSEAAKIAGAAVRQGRSQAASTGRTVLDAVENLALELLVTGGWPDGGAFQRLFSAWEKSAASFSESAVRNPRVLDLGAGLMRAHLAWVRAVQVSAEAWAPLFSAGSGKDE